MINKEDVYIEIGEVGIVSGLKGYLLKRVK